MKNYFSKDELACKCGCGFNVSPDLVEKLNEARFLARIPFVITSGARCEEHNEKVGGSPNSSHKKGLAADIKATTSSQRFRIAAALMQVGFTRIGVYKTFIHADIDPSKVTEVLWI